MKKVAIILIILLCAFFVYKETHRAKFVYKVIKINSPTEFVVDLNNNGKEDDGENLKLVGVEGFDKVFTGDNKQYYYKKLNHVDTIKNYYFSMDFLNKNLLNKDVEAKIFYGQNQNYAKLFLEGEDVAKMLLDNGYAIVKKSSFGSQDYLEFENIALIKENAQKELKKDVVVINTQNNIYHKLDCKYLNKLKEYKIIEREQLNGDEHPCKYCHIQSEETKISSSSKEPAPLYLDNFEVYILDFLNHSKPDDVCKSTACNRLVSLINNANSSIDVAVYSIHHSPKIVEALINAKKRGVNVRIVVDGKNYKNEPDDYTILEKEIPIKHETVSNSSRASMHNKFAIFDNKIVYIGSNNFTRTDLSGFNSNNVFVVKNGNFANIFKQEFEQMYAGKFSVNKSKITKNSFTLADGTNIKIYFSPKDNVITSQVIPLVKNAKKSIFIPCFAITHKGLQSAIIEAAKRGVDVKIILDATAASNKYSIHENLRKSNIKVKVENLAGKMHMKTIIIDERYIVTGSMNFSRNGEEFNDEATFIFGSEKLAKYYINYFQKVWNFIPDKWLWKNPRAESRDSIGSCTDGVDNDFDDKIDNDDDGCQKSNH